MVHMYLLSIIVHLCFIYFYLAFRINDNDSTTTYINNSTTTWLCNMHVVPIRASSPQLNMNDYTFNRASSPQLNMNDLHSTGHQAPNLIWMIYIQQGIKPPTWYEWFTFIRASSPQLDMSMHGLNINDLTTTTTTTTKLHAKFNFRIIPLKIREY